MSAPPPGTPKAVLKDRAAGALLGLATGDALGAPYENAVVTFPGRVTPEKWDRFIAILNAMKPSIITEDEPEN